ncbi:MAG TPA: extracellular solute-binding protein [Phototrophicaceae bacterium]|jgi:ABC-type glycerol-3-phosphate transport system substrate-binding protein|nr:extracellular solute-binding protein [Phototrophicaceae bacterium]
MRSVSFILSLVTLILCAGCDNDLSVTETESAVIVTDEATATAITTPVVRSASPEPQTTTLVIWLPEALSSTDNPDVLALLERQLQEFTSAEPNLKVEIRRKRSQDVGGIISTLRSASIVAPGALPDLTLLRRDDLLTAAQSDLIQPLEGQITTGVISGLSPHGVELGSINNELYGIPYMLELLLVAYQPDSTTDLTTIWSFETVLKNRLKFVFPAGRTSGISDVFLLQYLAAGGTPPHDGTMELSEQALLTTLTFYEQAREVGLVDASLLDYSTMLDYEPLLINGTVDAGTINSSTFMRLYATNDQFQLAFIPTVGGNPVTIMNGWMWVMVTDDSDRRAMSGRLVNWLMDSNRQGQYAQLLGMIPSQVEALRNYPFRGVETASFETLLQNATIPFLENDTGTVGRVMQNALAAVLRGDNTAEEATRDAVSQLSG